MLEIKKFPEDMSTIEVDRGEANRCLVSGLFEESVDVGGKSRRFYTYIAPGLCSCQPCLVLAPPEGAPVPEYLEESFWLDFAQEHQIFLHVLEPENGRYNGSDPEYMNRVYVGIQSQKHVPMLIVGTVKDMSHANYPRESWIAYDEFLSKFTREPDGTLLYMGGPAL